METRMTISSVRSLNVEDRRFNWLTSDPAISDHKMSGNSVMNSKSSTSAGAVVGLEGAAAGAGALAGVGLLVCTTASEVTSGAGFATDAVAGRGAVTVGATGEVAETVARAATGKVPGIAAIAAFGGVTAFTGIGEVTGFVGIALGGTCPAIEFVAGIPI